MLRSIALAALITMIAGPVHAQDPDLTLVNINDSGNAVPPGASLLDVSGNGRFVLFWSQPSLLPEDTVGQQLYVHDLETGTVELVSLDTNGNVVDDFVVNPQGTVGDPTNRRYISDDGRFVLFGTPASNVVTGVDPPPGHVYLYRRARVLQPTILVSVNSNDEPPNLPVNQFTMDPSGVAVMFQTFADNVDPMFPLGPWFLHRIDAPVGSSVRTRAACRDRTDTPRDCGNPALSCGGALVTARINGSHPWIEGEDLPFGGIYNEIAIGNTIDGNWVRVGNEADTPFPPGASNGYSSSNAVINCSGNRIAFWTNMELRNGDTADDDLYVFDLLSRQLWLIERSPGVSLIGPQAYRTISMSSSGLQIAFNTDLALDPADDNTFNDVYAFEMPINPPSLDFDFRWVSNNQGVAPISLFTAQPVVGGNGVVGFRTSATNAPWSPDAGTLGAVYARSNLPFEYITVDGFE